MACTRRLACAAALRAAAPALGRRPRSFTSAPRKPTPARSETAQNRKSDHPRPSFPETSRVDGVTPSEHRGTASYDGALPPAAMTRKAAHDAGARLSGVVKWFDRPKGYGFISPSTGGKDIFVHQTQVHAPGFRSLAPGEDVEYVVGELNGRTHAVEVTGPGGAFVKGTPKPKEEEVY